MIMQDGNFISSVTKKDKAFSSISTACKLMQNILYRSKTTSVTKNEMFNRNSGVFLVVVCFPPIISMRDFRKQLENLLRSAPH